MSSAKHRSFYLRLNMSMLTIYILACYNIGFLFVFLFVQYIFTSNLRWFHHNKTTGTCPTPFDLHFDLHGMWLTVNLQDKFTFPFTGNVAYGKPATQGVGTYADNVAARAVDGNHDPVLDHSHCAHPFDQVLPYELAWWEVDLGATYVVLAVNITNRVDFCDRCRRKSFHTHTHTCAHSHTYTSRLRDIIAVAPIEAEWCIYASVRLTNIDSDNGLAPTRRQAIMSDPELPHCQLDPNFNYFFFAVQKFSLKKFQLKISSAKWRPFCLGLNVLTTHRPNSHRAIKWTQQKTSKDLCFLDLWFLTFWLGNDARHILTSLVIGRGPEGSTNAHSGIPTKLCFSEPSEYPQ